MLGWSGGGEVEAPPSLWASRCLRTQQVLPAIYCLWGFGSVLQPLWMGPFPARLSTPFLLSELLPNLSLPQNHLTGAD